MTIAPLKLQENYWETINIEDADLEFLYNYLLDIETPQTSGELVKVLIQERIRREKENLTKLNSGASEIYRPMDRHAVGDVLRFPALEWATGKVIGVREGKNPEHPSFEVIKVDFGSDRVMEFAAGIEDHPLNAPISIDENISDFNVAYVMKHHGEHLIRRMEEKFQSIPDLVRIAGAWFPRSLLVDVNIGHLNLAEAVLEVANGGPLTTKAILDQIELPTDVNLKLTEFSMNLALQEDERFDEVGPSGETLWFLRRMEPEGVQNPPIFLRYEPVEIDRSQLGTYYHTFTELVYDELEPEGDLPHKANEVEVSLIYPHWRAGTLPLSRSIARFFPTAYEAPRVKFTFVDADTARTFPGWVVRPHRYVYGLREWYEDNDLIPGSLFMIKAGGRPGEVLIKARKKRPSKEWIRTVLVGADGGVVFTMLKQQISNEIDERMVIAVPDTEGLDRIWENSSRHKGQTNKTILKIMRELMKLSLQGNVHVQELYAGVNVVKRCPPGVVLHTLMTTPEVHHQGDMYFRINDQESEE
jgi:hypothetical protein